MSSVKGFYLAQEGHVVNALPPQSISGGKSALAVNMANYAHLSLIIAAGALASGATAVELFSCTNEAGANAVAQSFNYWSQAAGGAGNDVFQAGSAANSGRTFVASGSFAPAAVANGLIVIELDAAALPQGSPYVLLTLTDGADADYYCVIAELSGGRFTGDESPTVTV
jgi:hypothetical protein